MPIELSPRRTGLLGLGSVALILAAMSVTAIAYRGYAGEAYSPLNHFVSELGEIAVSRLAWVFNLGVVLGGVGLGSFLMLVRRDLTGRFRVAFGVAAAVAWISGALVGVFPMDYHAIHRAVSDAFFLSGGTAAAVFSLWLVAGPRSAYPRWLLAPGVIVVAIFVTFVGVYSTYRPADPDARIIERLGVWSVTILEWASLLSLLLWLACIAATYLRRPAD
jgi:hypothetical membrane protein